MAKLYPVGSRIRERRMALGLKQTELAARAGISSSYLNLIEHNRRGIAGKLLLSIADCLSLEPGVLTDGADGDLVRQVQATAPPDFTVEFDRTEDLVSRFPGWAQHLARLGERVLQLEATVEGLSDRLAFDPFLAEALHEILSSVTAIQATSGILAQSKGLEGGQQRRFQANIHDESRRLSDLSKGLLLYFESPTDAEKTMSTPQDEVDAFLVANAYHFTALETGGINAIEAMIAQSRTLVSQASKSLGRDILQTYAADASVLPLLAFIQEIKAQGPSVAALARTFAAPIPVVLRRLAFLPPLDDGVAFGIVECDASGAILMRKSLPGFALPRYGAGCSLLPLYQAVGRPHMAFRAILETAENMKFIADAFGGYLGDPGFDAPPVMRATMVFRPLHTLSDEAAKTGTLPVIKVGTTCRICPRQSCAARREPSIYQMTL